MNKLLILTTVILTSLSSHASEICASLYSERLPSPADVVKNGSPLQQEFDKLETAEQQLQFIHNNINKGYSLVEIIVQNFVHLDGQVNAGIAHKYYLVDRVDQTSSFVDLTKNKFQTTNKYGYVSKMNLATLELTIQYFSGVQSSPWSPKNLSPALRNKLGISSYASSEYWKIDNPKEFKEYPVGNFYLNIYRAHSALMEKDTYKVRRLNGQI